MASMHAWLDAVPDSSCPTAGKAAYGESIKFGRDANGVEFVEAFYVRTYHKTLRTQSEFIEAYRDATRIAKLLEVEVNGGKDGGYTVYPYSVFYVFFSQYLMVSELTLKLVGMALAAVLVVFTVIVGSPLTAVIVVTTVLMLIVDLIGFMTLYGISLNAVSAVNIVIAVGIGVEFCVHVARGATVMTVRQAVVEMGSSVFSGITLTKLFGILVLAFARSQIFQVYYFQMYLIIMLLGAAHGLILLPVLLDYATKLKKMTLFRKWLR